MSTYSKNLFSLLSEDGEVRPQPVPVKEEAKPVEQPKNDKRSPKSAGGNDIKNKNTTYPRTNPTTLSACLIDVAWFTNASLLLFYWSCWHLAQKRGGDKRRGAERNGEKRQAGRPQRGRQFDRHSATGLV